MSIPATWTAPAASTATDATNESTLLSYQGGWWFAVTRDSAGNPVLQVTTSPAGTWTLATIAMPEGFTATMVTRVIHGAGVWAFAIALSGGGGGWIAHTTDPAGTWTVTQWATTVYDAEHDTFAQIDPHALAYGDGQWLIVGQVFEPDYFASPLIASCSTPTGTWATTTGAGTGYDSSPILDVTWTGSTWVTVGTMDTGYGAVATATTPDGTWTLATVPDAYVSSAYLAQGNGRIVALINGADPDWVDLRDIWSATDPTSTWTVTPSAVHGITETMRDALYGQGTWLIGSWDTSQLRTLVTGAGPDGAYGTIAGVTGVWVATDGTRFLTADKDYAALLTATAAAPPSGGPRRRYLRQRQRPL